MNVPLFKVNMSPTAGEAAARVFASGFVGQGPRVDEFEIAFANMLGLSEAPLGVNSCTSAIDLALHLSGVGPGTEVITTPITCTATNGGIVTRGAQIVWADVDPLTGNIDPKSVAERITPKTKAVISVDWGGRACDYAALRQFGLPVIQDAAHCLYLPSVHGDYVAWSFGPIKHLTCGGYGGALLAPAEQADRARLLRWHGLDRRSSADFRCQQDIVEAGYRYHMTDDQAAIGLANMPVAAAGVETARDNAAFYDRALGGLPGIHPQPYDRTSSYWLYTLLADDRDGLKSFLHTRGIDSSQVHARNDKHTAFRAAMARELPLPGAEWFDAHQLSIPVGFWVGEFERRRIASAVTEFAQQARQRLPLAA